MIRAILIFSLFLIFTCQFQAAEYSVIAPDTSQTGFVVEKIQIFGNTTTKPHIILNEITFREGDTVNTRILEFNQGRVFSLGIFNRVAIQKSDSLTACVVITVEEAWYFWPIPYVELKDRDWDKISYGIDLLLKNVRGQNETLRFKTFFGYDPGFSISYAIPYLSRENFISAAYSISWWKIANKSEKAVELFGSDFTERYLYSILSFGKRLNHFTSVNSALLFEHLIYPDAIKKENEKYFKKQSRIGISLGFFYDTRDMAQFPSQGSYFNTSLQLKRALDGERQYLIGHLDFRQFYKLSERINSKFRIMSRNVSGRSIAFEDLGFLGFGERVRGYFSKKSEGESVLLSSLELNLPVFRDYLYISPAVYLPKSLREYTISVYNHYFIDAGSTSQTGYKFNLPGLKAGYGTGLTILVLPHRIMRFEIARNFDGRNEIIVELDISF